MGTKPTNARRLELKARREEVAASKDILPDQIPKGMSTKRLEQTDFNRRGTGKDRGTVGNEATGTISVPGMRRARSLDRANRSAASQARNTKKANKLPTTRKPAAKKAAAKKAPAKAPARKAPAVKKKAAPRKSTTGRAPRAGARQR